MATVSTEDKLDLFQGLLSAVGPLRLSRFDGRFYRIDGETEDTRTADALLNLSRQGMKLAQVLQEGPEPLLFTGRVGLLWLLCPISNERELVRVYGLGPFLAAERSGLDLDAALAGAGASLPLRAAASVLLRKLPVLSFGEIQTHAVMLHYLLWGEKLDRSRLRLLSGRAIPQGSRRQAPPDEGRAFHAEQETLRRVREGDLSLLDEADRGAMGDLVLRYGAEDALPRLKTAALTRLALLSRAAITGGLSVETGLGLHARYAQDVVAADSAGAILSLLMAMQADFVNRVHAVRTLKLSAPIEAASAYIDRHLEEPLTIGALAEMTGFAEYYFSRKFKKEMGMAPVEYIQKRRLEKAAVLLLTTSLDVGEIAQRLRFCSQSYFGGIFRRQYGTTPGQYRRAGMP